MLYVSLIIEALRGRPAAMFWIAALSQALLWFLLPSIFYAAPPGELATALAIGHEYQVGTALGAPLAFWLADVVRTIGGMTAVYLLAQTCIVVAYWGVFAIAREIVGLRHAGLAILLMVGIFAYTIPSPAFGPAILGAALWSLVLLNYWRALVKGRHGSWFLLGIEAGLLMLTTEAGMVLVALLCVFTATVARGRSILRWPEPWIALALAVVVAMPYFVWLGAHGSLVLPSFGSLRSAAGIDADVLTFILYLAGLAVAHVGLILLVALASGWPKPQRERGPTIDRFPAAPFARRFVYFFALLPGPIVALLAAFGARSASLVLAAPLSLFTGLAVVIAAGDSIRIRRERLVSTTWGALLVAPPLIVVLLLAVLPWSFGTELAVSQPARAMGQFFAETFQRRTGRGLAVVAGDPQLAALVAAAAPGRPRLYFDAHPEQSPWVRPEDIKEQGAVVLWHARDTAGTPPPEISQRFPGLVPELPHTFVHPVQGIMPVERIGWAVIRPQAGPQALRKQPASPPAR